MLLNAYSVYDTKALSYHHPFFFHHVGQATRYLVDVLDERNNILARHPGDYRLYLIGTYDDSSGVLTPLPPVHVVDIAALVRTVDQPSMFSATPLAQAAE